MKPTQARRAFAEEYKDFRVDVPEGKHLLHEIVRNEMTKRDAQVANAMGLVLKSGRFGIPGLYTLLKRWGTLGNPDNATIVMSDHVCEVADHEPLVTYARQHAPLKHVLINGLGIGVAIELLIPYVDHFTIVELSRSVIKLVDPHYQAKYPGRIDVIQHDALTYQPPKGERYNAVFHDIWDHISASNLVDMRLLHRRYGRLTDWQASWARNYCEADARSRKAHPEQYQNEVPMNELFKAVNTLYAITDDAAET